MAQLRKCMVAKHAEEEAKFQREQEEFAAAFTRSANTKAAAHAADGSTEATKVDAAEQASVDDGSLSGLAPPAGNSLTPPRAMAIAGQARPFLIPEQRRRAEDNRAVAQAKLKTAALKAERVSKQEADGRFRSLQVWGCWPAPCARQLLCVQGVLFSV